MTAQLALQLTKGGFEVHLALSIWRKQLKLESILPCARVDMLVQRIRLSTLLPFAKNIHVNIYFATLCKVHAFVSYLMKGRRLNVVRSAKRLDEAVGDGLSRSFFGMIAVT